MRQRLTAGSIEPLKPGAARTTILTRTPCERVIGQQFVITNWIGGRSASAGLAHHRLAIGDGLLLRTDGVTDLVPEVEIAALISRASIYSASAVCTPSADRVDLSKLPILPLCAAV